MITGKNTSRGCQAAYNTTADTTVKSWKEVNTLENTDTTHFSIRRQYMWLNKHTQINNKEIHWNEWHKKE